MRNKKPCFTIVTVENLRDYNNYLRKSKYLFVEAPTYVELKKKVREYLTGNEMVDDEIVVTRYRRGEWGEWFEVWTLDNGKVIIKKQGWQ